MFDVLAALVFFFVAVIACLGVSFLIYGLYGLFYAIIELALIEIKARRGGRKDE